MLAVECDRLGRVLVWTSQIRAITNTPEGTIATIDCPCGRAAFVAAGSNQALHADALPNPPAKPTTRAATPTVA